MDIAVSHDGLLTISTGASRKTKIWKQKQISWSDLLKCLSETKRTAETQAEFFKLGKSRQDEIKDVGGFVGGELEGGRRTLLATISRQLITLDADFAEQNLWEKIIQNFDNAACVYSTHKHTQEKPRLRLVIPLDRKVLPDEYQAISRKVAEHFGIENFDDTTYKPNQLMYYPSTSSDAEFFFQYQDGEFLSADKILTEYDDWQDQTTWARSSRSQETVQHELKKAEDPLTKAGLIGAFCRAYSISEAITAHLSDVYEECGEGRYTYKAGTSTGGAIVFADKFLYSFHATDPCSLQLCNAFDLVRIHKFGNLDGGKISKDITSRPSHIKMLDFASKDDKIKILMAEEVMADFDDLGAEKADLSWTAKLQRNAKSGKILSTRRNIRTILENDSRLKNCFGYDAFSQRIAITGKLFWRSKYDDSEYWNDGDDAQLRYLMETYFEIDTKSKIEDEVMSVANNNSFHKVQEYLRGLTWDGTPRMEEIFINYLGAEDTLYTRTITRKSLIAAVGRVFKPGVKYDNMIVLTGEQGIGKSQILAKLGKEWFSDTLSDLKNKDAYEGLRGKWILELGEMSFLNKVDNNTAKHFISKQIDTFRVAYGKRTQDFPRQCVFFGTTNERFYLKDKTGNRRFFPVNCSYDRRKKNVYLDENIDSEIDQVWAEAVAAWNTGESLWIGHEMEQVAKKIQEQHTEESPLTGAIEEYLNKKVPADWYSRDLQRRVEFIRGTGDFDEEVKNYIQREKICTAEIWCELLGGDLKKLSAYESKNVLDALLSLNDWTLSKDKMFFGTAYGLQKAFVRKKADDSNEVDLPF